MHIYGINLFYLLYNSFSGLGLTFKKDLWVFLTKIATKLILNVTHHGLRTLKMFHSRLPKTALAMFFTSLSYWKHQICILYQKTFMEKELNERTVWKSFNDILFQIMWNSAYSQKRIISACIKTLQFKLLPLSAAKWFILRST